MKITPREKRRHVSPFLAWGNFQARFARSTTPEKNGGLLVVYGDQSREVNLESEKPGNLVNVTKVNLISLVLNGEKIKEIG